MAFRLINVIAMVLFLMAPINGFRTIQSCTTQKLLSSTYEEFEITLSNIKLDDVAKSKIIYILLNKENEKELELMAVKKDKDKELELMAVKKDKDKELELMAVKKDKELELMAVKKDKELELMAKESELSKLELNLTNRIEAKEAYYLSKISTISCRSYLEKFFGDFVSWFQVEYKKNSEPFSYLDKVLLKNLNSEDPKMTKVNRVLEMNSTIRTAFFKAENISTDLNFPKLDGNVLYGTISEAIHEPFIRAVVIGSGNEKSYKDFFQALAKKYNAKLVVYDDEKSALGAEIVYSEIFSVGDD